MPALFHIDSIRSCSRIDLLIARLPDFTLNQLEAPLTEIIDVSFSCGDFATALVQARVKTVIRYYSRDTPSSTKRLTLREAGQFAAAGLRIGIVHESRAGNTIGAFTAQSGSLEGVYARNYAAKIIGQPADSAIYFGADVDATAAQVNSNILPYFKAVAAAFGPDPTLPSYQIGVYGSGATCDAVLSAGLASHAWLAQSTGWRGYKAFLQSKKWSLLQGIGPAVAGVACDPNQASGDFGDFQFGAPVAQISATSQSAQVIARSGVRLRAGPGTNFDISQTIPFGTRLHVVKTTGDWSLIDLVGDSAVDGFVNSHFIAPSLPTS
jgi:Domain of unknown function (DUF1906)/Bacterial SH3 domain